MHYYGMGYGEVKSLPINTFWFMNSCIPRLMAEQDMRSLKIASGSHTTEAVIEIRKNLVIEMGEVMKIDEAAMAMSEVADTGGIQRLKALM